MKKAYKILPVYTGDVSGFASAGAAPFNSVLPHSAQNLPLILSVPHLAQIKTDGFTTISDEPHSGQNFPRERILPHTAHSIPGFFSGTISVLPHSGQLVSLSTAGLMAGVTENQRNSSFLSSMISGETRSEVT